MFYLAPIFTIISVVILLYNQQLPKNVSIWLLLEKCIFWSEKKQFMVWNIQFIHLFVMFQALIAIMTAWS